MINFCQLLILYWRTYMTFRVHLFSSYFIYCRYYFIQMTACATYARTEYSSDRSRTNRGPNRQHYNWHRIIKTTLDFRKVLSAPSGHPTRAGLWWSPIPYIVPIYVVMTTNLYIEVYVCEIQLTTKNDWVPSK